MMYIAFAGIPARQFSFHKFKGTISQFNIFNKQTLYGNNFMICSELKFILKSSVLGLQSKLIIR